jgi:hypothetical protein
MGSGLTLSGAWAVASAERLGVAEWVKQGDLISSCFLISSFISYYVYTVISYMPSAFGYSPSVLWFLRYLSISL